MMWFAPQPHSDVDHLVFTSFCSPSLRFQFVLYQLYSLSHPLIHSLLSPSPTHHLWFIRPGCQAVFTECPFGDYSPRNHVAQLNYQWLQRLHLLLKHLENALFNQPIAAQTSMIPAHKKTLLQCPHSPQG